MWSGRICDGGAIRMHFSMEQGHHLGIPTVYVHGDIDAAENAGLEGFVLQAAKGSVQGVIVNLLDVAYAEAGSLRRVAEIGESLKATGQRMAVVCCSENVQRIFALSGVERRLDVFHDLDSAAEYLWSDC
jgi:anti-anti-sigma factor